MVGIAQLVERLVVVQEVAGSSPVTHPKYCLRLNALAGGVMTIVALILFGTKQYPARDNWAVTISQRPLSEGHIRLQRCALFGCIHQHG